MKFRTTLLLAKKTATGIEVPAEIVDALAAGKRPPVRVTINGYPYRSTIAPLGGIFMLPVSEEHRTRAGIAAGDEVEVDLELDTEPREVALPEDLRTALDREPAIRQRFDALSYSNQRRHVLAVEGAKTADTRQRRIDKVLAELGAG